MLCILTNIEGDGHARTTLTGATIGVDVTGQEKIFKAFQALGDIAFAYSYSMVLVEIQVLSIYQSNQIPSLLQ